MARAEHRNRLGEEISRIIRARTSSSAPGRSITRALVYGSMAALALTPVQVNAVSVGDISVRSALGEPMNAVIPVQLARGETLAPGCISMPRGASGLSNPANARVTGPQAVGPGAFELTVSTPGALFEPVYELNIRIDCPGTPILLREYVLMLDLPSIDKPVRMDSSTELRTGNTATFVTPDNRPEPQGSSRNLSSTSSAIPAGSLYRVREGDTLSTIARRIQGRPANTIWKMSNLIFRMNPNAFIRNSPDLIKLGVEIEIPDESDWSGPIESLRPAMPVPAETRSPQIVAPAREPSPGIRPEDDELTGTPQTTVNIETAPAETSDKVIDAPAPIAEAVQALERFNQTVSPFLDEQTVTDTPANAPELPASPPAAVRVAETAAPEAREVSPLTAIGVGILLGLAISILLLRTRLAAVGSMVLGRKRRVGAQGKEDDTMFGRTDEMFATDPNLGDETLAIPAIPVKQTHAQDYIVETQEISAEAITARVEEAIAEQDSAATDLAEPATDAGVTAEVNQAPSDDTLLDILFAENEDRSVTAEVPIAAAEIFENADIAAGIGDTAEMPPFETAASNAEQTAEMPQGASDETELSTAISDLPEIFSDEGYDAITQEVPSAETAETQAFDLENLAKAADEDDALSDTLMEALTMLEKDYEEELSASQILDQEAIDKALNADALSDLDAEEEDQDAKNLAKASG